MRLRYRRLLETVRDRTGGALRGAAAYGTDDGRLLYCRDDDARDALCCAAGCPGRGADDDSRGDQRRAIVELYDDSVVIHIREGPESGVVLSLDPGVARQLGGFVDECTAALCSDESAFDAAPVSTDG